MNIRKYSFCNRIVNTWNSLPSHVVEATSILTFEIKLDKYWCNQEQLFNYTQDINTQTHPQSYSRHNLISNDENLELMSEA